MPTISKLRPFDKIEIIRKCTQLSITQKLILLIIATHLGKNDLCYVSFDTLQEECCISKRTALSDNLKSLITANILHKISPSNGFKSNRYGINFNLLVTNGYQCSDPRLPVRSPTVTRSVTKGHPKRNIKNTLNEIKEEPLVINDKKTIAEKGIEESFKALGIKRKINISRGS